MNNLQLRDYDLTFATKPRCSATHMLLRLLMFCSILCAPLAKSWSAMSANSATSAEFEPKVVLVTLDGMRWQEVFYGADDEIAGLRRYVPNPKQIQQLLNGNKAEKLMPFLHQVVKKQGLLVGDQRQNSVMQVTNPWQVS